MKYFRYLPEVEYNNKLSVNIMARGKIRDMIINNAVVYYPYILDDGDRPDVISHKYYGSSDYTWLLFYANEIFDPFYDWPMEQAVFESFLQSKYDEIRQNNLTKYHHTYVENPTIEVDGAGRTTLEFTQISVGAFRNNKGLSIDKTTYLGLPAVSTDILSIYEVEEEKNEAKRQIKIIDKSYLSTIVKELKQLF